MTQELQNTTLNNFIQTRGREILAVAQKNTEDIVKTELALMDFELLLASNLSDKEAEKLTKESRKIREESWNDLSKEFSGNYDKMMKAIDERY